MHVLYHRESNVEMPHPSPLTRPKLPAHSYGTYNLLFIKSTSNHIKSYLCKKEQFLLNTVTKAFIM